MFGLLKKNSPSFGSVFFPGTIPPRAEEFLYLKAQGVELAKHPDQPDAYWRLRLKHSKWGKAEVVCLRDMPIFPRELLDWSPDLSDEERARAALARTGLTVTVDATRQNVLADRKRMLWYLGALMGDDGVVALDHVSGRFWPRSNLDNELMHDADLDVEALYCLHLIHSDTPPPAAAEAIAARRKAQGEDADEDEEPWTVHWLHSHGLAEMGAVDFDILNPSPSLRGQSEPCRALAFAIIEGTVKPGGVLPMAQPKGDVWLVPAAEFQRQAAPEHQALRDHDENHDKDRVVLCDPARRRLLGLLSAGRPRPSAFLSGELADGTVFRFSDTATQLMAARALGTFGLFRELHGEFGDAGLPMLVKLGIPTDHGGPDGREHIWFQVHGFEREAIDGTCLNSPYDVSALSEGQRGLHPAERLTDWTVMTPFGPITPRELSGARLLRERKDEMRGLLATLRAAEEAMEGVGG